MSAAERLLETWFGDDLDEPETVGRRTAHWFASTEAFDDTLREGFGALPDRARGGALDDWRASARPALARVLALDQLPRNLYRGTPDAFAYDAAAVEAAEDALARGHDDTVHPAEAAFFYLPFEHAEDRALQERSVACFRALRRRAPVALAAHFDATLDYAERHRVVVERFGRFPHRNAILGRPSTPEERAYLEGGGDTFG